LNVHPATSAHGVVKGANQLLQHQTILPTIASAISLIFTRCPACSSIPHNPPACAAPTTRISVLSQTPSEFCNEKNGETANELPVIKITPNRSGTGSDGGEGSSVAGRELGRSRRGAYGPIQEVGLA